MKANAIGEAKKKVVGVVTTAIVLGAVAGIAVSVNAISPVNPKSKAKLEVYPQVLANAGALVTNPSFEPDLTGWKTWGPSGSLAWDISSDALFGDNSATISGAGDYDMLFVNLTDLTPGVDYYGFGWLKTKFTSKSASFRVVAAGYSKADAVVQYLFTPDQRGKSDWTLQVLKVKPQQDVVKIAFQACCLGAWEPDDEAFVDGLTFIRADKLDADLLAALKAR